MKIFVIVLSLFICSNIFSQSITIADSNRQTISSSSPYSPYYDYTYVQTIYLQSEIQATGTITSLTYYYRGHTLSNSDSLLIFMGNTSKQHFNNSGLFIPTRLMKRVFWGHLTNYSIPGPVTITLDTPFVYNSDSNLVIAVNEKRPSSDYSPGDTNYFKGFQAVIRNFTRSYSVEDLNQIDPYVYETLPPFTLPSPGADIGFVTLNGLTPLPCQTPQKVRFTNINHDNAKVLWSPPSTGNAPAGYDLYYSTNEADPTASSIVQFTNLANTQQVITGLQPTTTYKVWLRSHCSGNTTSLWTLIDSFTTICNPTGIPTPSEQFNVAWLPPCWTMAFGALTPNTQLDYNYDSLSNSPWDSRPWRNVSSSNNYAAHGYFVGAGGDSLNAWLISPPYNLGTSGNKSLEFDLALNRDQTTQQGHLDADDKFAIVISTDNGTTWSSIKTLRSWVYPQTIPAAGQHITISLSGYTGLVRIGFYTHSLTYTELTDLFVDNVQITGVMPVKLLDFTGTKEGVANLLKWRTATESNNRGFELQRSTNSSAFSTLGFVPTKAASGNSTAELSYQYTDKKPFATGSYYRLKQVDFDGKFSYSNIVFIKGEPITELVLTSLYPNPTNQLLNVMLETPKAQKVQMVIADLAGKTMLQQSLQLVKGVNNKTMNVATLAKGTYIVKVVCADGCERAVRKFVKE